MKQKNANKALIYICLLIGTVVVIFPFIWMLSTSLKTLKEVFVFPPQWIPKDPQWGNYAEVWKANNFLRYFLNSLIVSSVLMVGQIITSSLAAFAFARMDFRGKNFLFMMVLGTTMVPTEILLIPNYVIISKLHWINTYQALIVPSLGYALGIFMLRQHFMTFPKDLEDAARIDGCNRGQMIWHVTLPGIRSVIVIMLLLKVSSILDAGFDQVYAMYSTQVLSVGDIIDTWVYRVGLLNYQYSVGSAVGLMKAIISMVLVISANYVSRRLSGRGMW